ncbi:isomerase (plasmid) [Microvirga ossetica]|uniref:Isomerase n=1 Tax=Microvirga ossetica TaxID=1882682 RepID=A0A1B2EVV2_9HYPH|nr:isomerase [Microvirga ossetica]
MKIREIQTFLMQAGPPLESGWAAAGKGGMSTAQSRQWLFVKVVTDEGITGVGECSGWPRVVETAIKDLTPLLLGQDPTHIQRLWNRMKVAMMGHGMTGTVGYGAMAGIEMALWDIKGKALETPVWNLLGGKVRDRIRAYAHASRPEYARDLVQRGYTAIKTTGVSGIVDKVGALRDAVGQSVDLIVDLHGPPWLAAADAVATGRELEQFKLLFLEDPVAPEDLRGFRRIRDAVQLPLAAGERHGGLWGVRNLLVDGLVDVIQPDTGRSGGIGQMMRMAHLAETFFAFLAPHSGSLGPVAEYAAVHVLAAIPNTLILERFGDDWEGRQRVVTPMLDIRDGYVIVPDRPGLGVDIVEGEIVKHPPSGNVSIPGSPTQQAYEAGTFDEHTYFQARWRRPSLSGHID